MIFIKNIQYLFINKFKKKIQIRIFFRPFIEKEF